MLRIICAGIAITGTSCAALAAPYAPVLAPTASPRIELVSGGCGRAFHRGPNGACIPNDERIVVEPVGPRVVAPVRLPPPCPRGYVRDPRPDVQLCYPRF